MKYIDCHASTGKWSTKDQDHPWMVETMLSDMKRCRIHGALIFSNIAKELTPSFGNRQVLEICEQHARFIPCWVALPDQCGDYLSVNKFVQNAIDNKIRAIKIFPKMHNYLPDERTIGKLLDALEEADMPLIVDRGESDPVKVQIEWQEIGKILKRNPQMNLILHNVRWQGSRMLMPLLEEFKNLYIEFSAYQSNRIIEFLVDKIGSDQLLFGTGMMEKSPGAAKAFLDYAEIDDHDRQEIASENLIRLLKLASIPDEYPDDQTSDVILQKARKAQPIDDMEVIDSHAHHNLKGYDDNLVVFMPKPDAAGIIERNRRIGVNITCSSPWIGIWNSESELGNLSTRDAILEFPNEFIGYATFDPRYITDWKSELKRVYEEFGILGMKPYFPRTNIPYNDNLYKRWFQYGNKHHLFALMHMSEKFTEEMEDLAKKYPEISFLLAHSGWTYEVAKKHIKLAKKFPNVFCEITFTSVTNGLIEYMVKEIGSERVIYGSDSAMRDPIPQFGWVVYADISEEEKRDILGRNMRKIIDRCSTEGK